MVSSRCEMQRDWIEVAVNTSAIPFAKTLATRSKENHNAKRFQCAAARFVFACAHKVADDSECAGRGGQRKANARWN